MEDEEALGGLEAGIDVNKRINAEVKVRGNI